MSGLLALAADHAVRAAERTGGLLDPTLGASLARAGYATDWDPARRADLRDLLGAAPARRAASANPAARWQEIRVDRAALRIERPAGLRLDLGAPPRASSPISRCDSSGRRS